MVSGSFLLSDTPLTTTNPLGLNSRPPVNALPRAGSLGGGKPDSPYRDRIEFWNGGGIGFGFLGAMCQSRNQRIRSFNHSRNSGRVRTFSNPADMQLPLSVGLADHSKPKGRTACRAGRIATAGRRSSRLRIISCGCRCLFRHFVELSFRPLSRWRVWILVDDVLQLLADLLVKAAARVQEQRCPQ